jgi:two-component system sensor histidine kinase and response regulator WspE
MAEDFSRYSMLELFRLEAESQTAALAAALLDLEAVAPSPDAVAALMRAAHSLKGAARIIGLEPAVRVAHALEDVFVTAGDTFAPGRRNTDDLLAAVDFLAAIGRAADPFADPGHWDNLADGLVARLAARQAGSLAADVPPAAELPEPAPRPGASGPSAGMPPPPQRHDARVVRVSADSLSRLLGLAGESRVESRQLGPFVAELRAVRSLQAGLCDTIRGCEGRLQSGVPPAAVFAAAREQADAVLERLSRHSGSFQDFAGRSEDLSHRLHREVVTSRMRPLADGIRGFPRLVRDVARSLGKQVRLEVRGEGTGVDRDILDTLEAPLSHLVRNALDHGIESPERRAAAGKPATGTIVLEARHRAGMLVISVADDGAGIDMAGLRATARARGLVSGPMAETLSEAELLDFLFLPGFSTRDRATEISGRGVGLDAVQGMAKAVGGSVRVSTRPGLQTVFTLQLPITMSVIRAMLVSIGGEPYAFPLSGIDRIISCGADAIRTVEGRQFVPLDGASIGLVLATQILDLPASAALPDPLPVVVIGDGDRRFGVIVDAFLGERDLEVRPLDARLGRVPDVSSCSILEHGDPVLIIDVEDLARSIEGLLSGRRLTRIEFARIAARARRRQRILVVDDSPTVREVERRLLLARGYDVDVATDGLDAWDALRSADFDLVVSDVDMPRLDGIGLVTAIKADPLRRDIPVVIVSYKDRREDRLRGLEAGANRYLTKASFHDATFITTIVDLIGEPTEQADDSAGSPAP